VKKLLMIVMLCSLNIIRAEGDGKDKLRYIFGEPSSTHLNIGNFSTPIYGDGRLDISSSGNSGFIYPKGVNKAVVYQSGFVWGGKIDSQIRTGGSVYRTGLKPGKILSNGNAEDPDAPNVRVYRVRPDYENGSMESEVNDREGNAETIREQYRKDWYEWPAADGAPYEDVDNNGIFNPDIDKPGVPGAGQTIWYVANDLDSNQTKYLYGALPFGFEMQVTIWGYNLPAPVGNMMFRKYIVINKGSNIVEDMYFGAWSDPDVGDASDDYVGCDTLMDMGFAYNAWDYDAQYRYTPPSVGFQILQGPLVDGAPSDVANFMGWKIPGKKNLPMTAFGWVYKNYGREHDPPLASYSGTIHLYNYLQGLHMSGIPFMVPASLGGGATSFPYSGNPVTGEGYLLSMESWPGDKRLMESMGPFEMMPGDTQEVIIAQIVAGAFEGCSNLGSLGLLKLYAEHSRYLYEHDFDAPGHFTSPTVNATSLERELILTWDTDENRELETYTAGGYEFQGYKVYQLSSGDLDESESKLIATFDKIDHIKAVVVSSVNYANGQPVLKECAEGKDTGIIRYIQIKEDSFSNLPLNDGTNYFFAVTSYFISLKGGELFGYLESLPEVIKAMPESPNIGVQYGGEYGEEIETSLCTGISTGTVSVAIVDPTKLTGDEYEVQFTDDLPYKNKWSLINKTKANVLLTDKSTETGIQEAYLVDGFRIEVSNAAKTLIRSSRGIYEVMYEGIIIDQTIWHSWGYYPQNRDKYFISSGSGSIESVLQNIEYGSPRDFELRFTENGGYAVYAFEDNKIARVPFELWDIGNNSDDDTSDDVRMIPFLISNDDSTKSFWGWGTGTDVALWDEFPSSDRIYWADPEDDSYGTAGYDKFAVHCELSGGAGSIYDLNSDTSADGYYANLYGDWKFPISDITVCDYDRDGMWPPPLTVIRFETPKPFTSDVTFCFTSPGTTVDEELYESDTDRINVFPNPYYGHNPNAVDQYHNYVMFNHLPKRAKFRIFNLAGHLVRTLEKDDDTQFYLWDLQNEHRLQAPSGLYIIYIEMPDIQKVKVLKLAIVQREVIPDTF